MAKLKLRFRNEIIQALTEAHGPISLKNLVRTLFPKEDVPKAERLIEKELRFLIKMKEVEKITGSLYRIRPPKNARIKIKKEREHDFEVRENRNANRELQSYKRDLDKRELEDTGSRRPSKKKDRTIVTGKVSKNSRGFAFVAPINPPPFLKEDVFLNPEEAEELLTGDIVEIVLDETRAEKGYSGRLLTVVERGMQKTVARYVRPTPYAPAMAEVDTKDVQLQIELDSDPAFKDVVDGAAILVDITEPPSRNAPAQGRIISVLADSLNSTTDDLYILTKHKLSETFPDEVIAESQAVPSKISKEDIKGREDLRNLPFVTIDGADARDFDDAVCAASLTGGGTRLWVAIADVAHYVKPGSALDNEAYARGTSVYFPHRVLPMLPERLSNGLCSLNPNEDRLAMVCEMDFDASGKKIKHRVLEAVFQSQHRCVYETLQQFFDRPNDNGHEYNPRVKENLRLLFDLYMKLHAIRIKRGAVDLNLPEAKVKVNRETGEVDAIVRSERLDTHRLIEEFMIIANEGVSEIMEEAKQAFLFRVHETPDPEAAKRFIDVSKSLHVRMDDKWLEALTPQTYQKMLKAIEDNPAARVLNFLLLRSMKQAYYSPENLYHFGLASKAYTHFTSPIRRYPDLIVHRLLKAFIHKSKKEAAAAKGGPAKDLAEAALHCSQRERVAVDAERELVRIKQVRYAERHLGEEHMGTVVGISAKGAFIELETAFVEGFVPIDRFGEDFGFNERLYQLRGKRSGQVVQIGDKVNVQIVRTVPHLQQIELEPLNGKPRRTRAEIQRAALEEAAPRSRREGPQPSHREERARFGGPRREEREERGERRSWSDRPAKAAEKPTRPAKFEKTDREDKSKKGEKFKKKKSDRSSGSSKRDPSERPQRFERSGEKPSPRDERSSRGDRRDRGEQREERTALPKGEARERIKEIRDSRQIRPFAAKEEKEEKKKDKEADKRDFWKPEDFE